MARREPRPVRAHEVKLSDRERILTSILMRHPIEGYERRGPNDGFDFRPWWDNRKAQAGDLVRCDSQRVASEWTFAWLVQLGPTGGPHLLREIGGERTLWMHNESVSALRGMPPEELLEGKARTGYLRVRKVLGKLYDQHHCDAPLFADYRSEERSARLSVRPHGWLLLSGKTCTPLELTIPRPWSLPLYEIRRLITEATPEGWYKERLVDDPRAVRP